MKEAGEPPAGGRQLDQVRGELQRLGYLSHRFERFLLRDALVPRGPWRGLLRLAAKVGLVAGSLLAAVNALALAEANGVLDDAPAEIAPLFLHVGVPTFAAATLGFLGVVALFRALLTLFPRRGLDIARLGAALGATALLFGAGVYVAADFLLALPPAGRALAAAVLLAVAAGVAKLVADGLLAFGIRLTHAVPHERLVPRRFVGVTVAASAVLVAAAALLLSPAARPAAPAALPGTSGSRAVLIGVDGVLPDEIDFELAQGGVAHLTRLARTGGVVARFRRAADASPAEVWTTVATGRAPADHGVRAVDGFRPRGMATTLARTGPWRAWFEEVATPLALAEHRPLLSARRRAPAVWELVARGGRPVASVNWWATYPAEALPGVVLAHGAYELLERGPAPGAVAPPDQGAKVESLLRARGADADVEALADLPVDVRRALTDALDADRFHRDLARAYAAESRAVAVYLPALDLAAHAGAATAELGAPRFGALVRAELAALDALVGELGVAGTTLVVVFDPGRRGAGEGRVLVWGPDCAATARPDLELERIAASLLRAAGMAQSRELPEPAAFCRWPPPPATVATYGERALARDSAGDDAAYLENLRSLGYL